MDLSALADRLKEINELAQQANDASEANSERTWNRVGGMEQRLQTDLDYDGSGLTVEWSDKHNCFVVF